MTWFTRLLLGGAMILVALAIILGRPDRSQKAALQVEVVSNDDIAPGEASTSDVWMEPALSAESIVPELVESEAAHPALMMTQFKLPNDVEEARAWAMENPHAAFASMTRATSGAARDTVVEVVCTRLAESNAAEAVVLAEHFGEGCTNLLENLVEQWAGQNEPAAKTYVLEKPPGATRDRLVSRVAFTVSRQNPAAAATLVAESISPGNVQNEAAMVVLHQWTLRDPVAALDWARLFPESLRDRALKEIGGALASGNP